MDVFDNLFSLAIYKFATIKSYACNDTYICKHTLFSTHSATTSFFWAEFQFEIMLAYVCEMFFNLSNRHVCVCAHVNAITKSCWFIETSGLLCFLLIDSNHLVKDLSEARIQTKSKYTMVAELNAVSIHCIA